MDSETSKKLKKICFHGYKEQLDARFCYNCMLTNQDFINT